MGTKSSPGARDCYAAAEPDEPMFVLLARDVVAPETIVRWISLREELIRAGLKPDSDQATLREAREVALDMIRWRRRNRRQPNMVPGRARVRPRTGREDREDDECMGLALDVRPRCNRETAELIAVHLLGIAGTYLSEYATSDGGLGVQSTLRVVLRNCPDVLNAASAFAEVLHSAVSGREEVDDEYE